MIPSRNVFASLVAAIVFSGLANSASAGVEQPTPTPVAPAPAWEFRLEPYLWLAGISGTTGVLGETVPTDLGAGDLLKHLKMAFAAQAELRHDRWGLLADFTYADIGGFVNRQDPRIQQFSVDNKVIVFSFAALYRVYRSNRVTFDLLAGGRVNSTKLRITQFRDISPPATAPNFVYLNESRTQTWVDPIIGARTQLFMTDKLFLGLYGDIGGFGVGSHLSWQVQPTLGWKFTQRTMAEIGWRILSNNYTNGGFTYNVKQQGIYTGVSFSF